MTIAGRNQPGRFQILAPALMSPIGSIVRDNEARWRDVMIGSTPQLGLGRETSVERRSAQPICRHHRAPI